MNSGLNSKFLHFELFQFLDLTEKLHFSFVFSARETKVMILSRNLHFIPNYNTTAINMKLVSTQVEEKDNSKPAVRRRTSTTKPIKKGAHFLVK